LFLQWRNRRVAKPAKARKSYTLQPFHPERFYIVPTLIQNC
jgi:hypothetical protein